MQRRIALALSLALTTIVGVSLIALGSSAGWFSEPTTSPKTAKAAAPPPASDDAAAALLYLAAISGPQGEPNVITEYVYVNDAAGVPQRAPAAAQGNLAPAAAGTPAAPATAGPSTASPATPRPAPTDRPAPSATAVTASGTPQPAATTPPTTPPAAPPSAPCPTEFVSTVTSVQPSGSNTNVTWSNGAITRVVAGTAGGSSLAPGVQAHVHALALSAGCTATEIQVGG